jgi:hypothetical protein
MVGEKKCFLKKNIFVIRVTEFQILSVFTNTSRKIAILNFIFLDILRIIGFDIIQVETESILT